MRLLWRMIKEEWRTHSELFGSKKFGLLPVLLLGMNAFIAWFLVDTAFSQTDVALFVHALVFFMGMNVGTIGLVGRDALKNLLGEANLLIFSSRTLPISQTRILLVFVIKDLIYYTFLFILPIVGGVAVAYSYLGLPMGQVGLMLITVPGMFLFAVAVSFLGAVLYLRGRVPFLIGLAVASGLFMVFRAGLVEFTPLALFFEPTMRTAFFGFVPIVVLLMLSAVLFGTEHRKARTARPLYPAIMDKTPSISFLGAKTVLDIIRSSGNVFKLVFSQLVVFAFFVYLIESISFLRIFVDAPGASFAVLMALASVSVYNWVNRFDRLSSYLILPVDEAGVLGAKMKAFLYLAIPSSYPFVIASGVMFGWEGMALGLLVLPLLIIYMGGITAYMAGMEPNKMLLDVWTFTLFGAATSIVIVPAFILSILSAEYSGAAIILFVLSVFAAGTGVGLFKRAKNKRRHDSS
ncbi:MAG: hypothetical protein MUP66_00920 [Candidatus Nanohaloarchaeota archaeon QJJ-5]|nr:hypothetical protein [Candidatus Nanohaloarchaeota archaeon QJJ-5]